MIATRKISVVALAVALGAGGMATYAIRELGKSRDAVAAASRDRDDLRAKLKKSEEAVSATNERLAQARLHAESLKEDLGRLFPQKTSPTATPSLPAAATSTLAASATPTVRSMAPAAESRYGGSMFVA